MPIPAMQGGSPAIRNSWSGWRFSDLGEIGDGVVHFPMMGPLMPLLANSSTVSEITERVKQSIAVNTGSVDEHFTWSYRLLSPNGGQKSGATMVPILRRMVRAR